MRQTLQSKLASCAQHSVHQDKGQDQTECLGALDAFAVNDALLHIQYRSRRKDLPIRLTRTVSLRDCEEKASELETLKPDSSSRNETVTGGAASSTRQRKGFGSCPATRQTSFGQKNWVDYAKSSEEKQDDSGKKDLGAKCAAHHSPPLGHEAPFISHSDTPPESR